MLTQLLIAKLHELMVFNTVDVSVYLFVYLCNVGVVECRIVLERPEYGYATYFFEIVDSIPIDWQIKRLVAVMKLSSCGRGLLIENKALVVTAFSAYLLR